MHVLHANDIIIQLIDVNLFKNVKCNFITDKITDCNDICDSEYRKVPVVGRLDFELWGCKV